MKKFKIAIVGAKGHVGTAITSLFQGQEDFQLVLYDLDFGEKEQVNQCDLAIVCVPTPRARGGSCDVSIVEEVVAWLKTPLIMIKSTVSPGTTNYLKKKYKKRIVMSPEFYGESKYYTPESWSVKGWQYMIVGGDKKDCEDAINFFVPVLGPLKSYFITDATTAEIVKYAENIFGAMKVIWANEFYEICQRFGVSYNEVRELWAQDPRINRTHTSVFPKDRGFSGKCFPKDLAAMIVASEQAGYKPKFLKEIQRSNKRFRRMNK